MTFRIAIRRATARILVSIALWLSLTPVVARAVVLHRGDLLIADDSRRLVAVNPATGAQALLSYDPGFVPLDMAVGPQGVIYALGYWNATGFTVVMRVDPTTGAQTPVYDPGRGTNAQHFAVGHDGQIYFPDFNSSRLLCVDPVTGNAAQAYVVPAKDLAVDRAAIVWLIQDRPDARVIWVAHLCGATTPGPSPPPVPPFTPYPRAISTDPDGRVYVLADHSVQTIDPVTHRWSEHSVLNDSPFPVDLAAVSSQAVYVLYELHLVPHRGRVAAVRRYENGGVTGTLVTGVDLLSRGLAIAIYDWSEESTPTLRGTWGRLKAIYR